MWSRPVVAAPGLVGRDVEKLQTLGRAFFQKSANCFFLLRILNIDADSLRLGERVLQLIENMRQLSGDMPNDAPAGRVVTSA